MKWLTRQERQVVVFVMIVVIGGSAVNFAYKHCAAMRPVLRFNPSYGKININTADSRMLREIPGVGDTLSKRIIEYRYCNGPFVSADDLSRVKGFSGGRLDRARDFIAVE